MDQQVKVLPAKDIEAIVSKYHRCGWGGPPVPRLDPPCGCMCGTSYGEDGYPVIARGGRNGMRCKCADERGRLRLDTPAVEARTIAYRDGRVLTHEQAAAEAAAGDGFGGAG